MTGWFRGYYVSTLKTIEAKQIYSEYTGFLQLLSAFWHLPIYRVLNGNSHIGFATALANCRLTMLICDAKGAFVCISMPLIPETRSNCQVYKYKPQFPIPWEPKLSNFRFTDMTVKLAIFQTRKIQDLCLLLTNDKGSFKNPLVIS